MATTFERKAHPYITERSTAANAKVPAGINSRVATLVTGAFGTMWCAYAFAILALVALPAAIKTGDPLALVQWISQTFLQLVLLSVIIVGQNITSQASDKRAEMTYKDAEATFYEGAADPGPPAGTGRGDGHPPRQAPQARGGPDAGMSRVIDDGAARWGSETPIRARTVPVRSADVVGPLPSSSAPSSVSSSAVTNKAETTEARTSRSSSSAINSGVAADGGPTATSDRRPGPARGGEPGSPTGTAGSPSSSRRRRCSAGTASSYAGSGPTAGRAARAGRRSIPSSVPLSSGSPERTPRWAASGSRASSASSASEPARRRSDPAAGRTARCCPATDRPDVDRVPAGSSGWNHRL